MGEYIKINGEEVKLGTCEDLYYARLYDLQECEALGISQKLPGNDAIAGYLNPAHGYRYRFPYPDEDGTQIGHYDPYSRGVAVLLDAKRSPGLIASLRGEDWQHHTLCHSATVGKTNAYGVNISFPCPLSVDFAKTGLTTSRDGAQNVIEIVQQKQIEDEVWTVIRCGYCGAMVRIDHEQAAELCDVLRNYCLPDLGGVFKEEHAFKCEMANRIEAGYMALRKAVA